MALAFLSAIQAAQAQTACASNPCQNGGTCTNVGADFSCACPPAVGGTLCQTLLFDTCVQPALIKDQSNPTNVYVIHPQTTLTTQYWSTSSAVVRSMIYCSNRVWLFGSNSGGSNLQSFNVDGSSPSSFTPISGGTGCSQNPAATIQGMACANSTHAFFIYSNPSGTKCTSLLNLDTLAVNYIGSFSNVATFTQLGYDTDNRRLFAMTSARAVVEINTSTGGATNIGTMPNACQSGTVTFTGLSYDSDAHGFRVFGDCGASGNYYRAIFAVSPSALAVYGAVQNVTLVPSSTASMLGLSIEVNKSSSVCQHGGYCISNLAPLGTSLSCNCPDGYTGALCQTEIDECASNPCQNSGTCTEGLRSYTCQCLSGFTGVRCETDIDECASAPCQNGGTCVDGSESFTCQCPAGFTGILCETDVDDCASMPCQNGGTCTDSADGYSCDCDPPYSGTECQDVPVSSSSSSSSSTGSSHHTSSSSSTGTRRHSSSSSTGSKPHSSASRLDPSYWMLIGLSIAFAAAASLFAP